MEADNIDLKMPDFKGEPFCIAAVGTGFRSVALLKHFITQSGKFLKELYLFDEEKGAIDWAYEQLTNVFDY